MVRRKIEWLSPKEASKRITERAGYVITPEDLRLLKKTKKIRNVKRGKDRFMEEDNSKFKPLAYFYDAQEIDTIKPPDKRVKRPIGEWYTVIREQNEAQKDRAVKLKEKRKYTDVQKDAS